MAASAAREEAAEMAASGRRVSAGRRRARGGVENEVGERMARVAR